MREGDALLCGGQRPHSHCERGLGHIVAADVLLEHTVYHFGSVEASAEQSRRQPLANREPGGVDRFRAVIRLLASHTLRPCHDTVRIVQLEQEDPPLGADTGGNTKRFFQREANLTQDEAVETKHKGQDSGLERRKRESDGELPHREQVVAPCDTIIDYKTLDRETGIECTPKRGASCTSPLD